LVPRESIGGFANHDKIMMPRKRDFFAARPKGWLKKKKHLGEPGGILKETRGAGL